MDALSITASITALLGLTSTVITYLNDVKGASKDRGRILSEIASVNGILFILQDQADQQNDTWSSTFQSLNLPKGPLDQLRMALERLSSGLAPPATPLKKLGNAVTWHFQKGEIKEILGSIEHQKTLLTLARQNDHIKLSKAIKDDVALVPLVRDKVQEVAKGVSRIQMSELTREHQEIIEWLNGPDPWTNYNKARRDRNPKTGSWFIEGSEYADWKTTPGSFLWLHGIPGCGKTILSSTILENMLNHYSQKPNSAVLFFYFDFNDTEKQQHEKMIRSLICQLSSYNTDSVLQNLYLSCSNGNRQPAEQELLNTLHQMMASVGDTYIVLDALDECVERDELFADLEQMVSWEGVDLHVLATGRREPDIEEALTPLSDSRNRISIQSKLVDADIRTYIQDRLQFDRKLKKWQKDPKIQLEIKDALMTKAHGMFRWVACQLDLLRDCFNVRHLRKTLASLPETLDDTYARILCNIDKQHKPHSREILKILQWLSFSTRPLQVEELAEIVAIDVDETPRFDPDRRWLEPGDVLKICSSLITLTSNWGNHFDEENGSESSDSDPEGSMTYVRLAHFSVKEYLVSDRIRRGTAAHYSIREIESHGVLAGDCIAYILQFHEPGSLTPETLAVSPLARYAASQWAIHAKKAEEGPIENAPFLTTELLTSEEGLRSWIRIADPEKYGSEDLSRDADNLAPQIYYASLVGLLEHVKMLIEKSTDVNAQGGDYGSALQAASYRGHKDVVQTLLNHGADVNARGGFHGNALQAASSRGHKDIVQILLDHGADINAQGGYQGNAVQAASRRGFKDVVQILLNNGADVNAWGKESEGTALQLASEKGYENVVKMLLDKGADVNARSQGSFKSALQLASEKGYENVVKMLLDNGPDVDVGGKRSKDTALRFASWRGHENVVKLLVNNGADVNARSARSRSSALHFASEKGHENVVKLLLDNGADVNARSEGSFGTALQRASENDRRNVVKMLLDNGADVSAVGGTEKRSAVQLAFQKGHEKIMNMLLAHGAVMPEEESESSESEYEDDASEQHVEELDSASTPPVAS